MLQKEPPLDELTLSRRTELAIWLRGRLSDSLQLPPSAIRSDVPLTMYGLDSMFSAMMLTEIEDGLGVLVDPADLPPDMTLDDLAEMVHDSEIYQP